MGASTLYIHPRKDRHGNLYFSFSYTNKDGKRVRLKKSEHPFFDNREKAQSWADSQDAIKAAEKDHIARKLAWKTAYYDFQKLLMDYGVWQKQKAPNSWKSCVFYLEKWTFPFFLVEKQAGNVNNWHLFFLEFFDWLQGPHKDRKIPLAASTVNNIAKATNTFFSFLLAYGKIDPDSVRKMETLPEHKINHRTFADVISPDEMVNVYTHMKKSHPPAADFFYVLWHTGMRFSELYGISLTSLFKGQITNKALHDELVKSQINYIGYIYLESQPEYDDRKRLPDGSIPRKPLKSCKTIGPKNARIIPIRDKEIWNVLAIRYKKAMEQFEAKECSLNKDDFPLFDDLEWNKAQRTLRQSYSDLGLPFKSYHCCRHSFTTHLVGETRNFFLVRAITGHKKDKSFERYLHIYEQISLESIRNDQIIDVV